MRANYRVIVSIATVPGRMPFLKPTLASLLEGEMVPDEILIVHPEYCNWAQSRYEIPDLFDDDNFCRGIVRRVVSSVDWGPGTKLLGALETVPEQCYLVLADDDVIYHPSFLSGLMKVQAEQHDTSFSYYTYRYKGLTLGQGCDGYSFWRPNLDGAQSFAEEYAKGTPLLYHDDLWIGFYLFLRGVKVKRVMPPVGRSTIYDQVLPNDVLSSEIVGDLARDNITREHFKRLTRTSMLSPRQRVQLSAVGTGDAARMLVERALRKTGLLRKC